MSYLPFPPKSVSFFEQITRRSAVFPFHTTGRAFGIVGLHSQILYRTIGIARVSPYLLLCCVSVEKEQQ